MFENENYEDELSHNDFVLDAIRKWLMWYDHSLVLLNNIGNEIFKTFVVEFISSTHWLDIHS